MQQKTSISELRKNIEKTLIRQRVMAMEVGRRVVVTPEEIKAYYDLHKDTMYDRTGSHMALPRTTPTPMLRPLRRRSGRALFLCRGGPQVFHSPQQGKRRGYGRS